MRKRSLVFPEEEKSATFRTYDSVTGKETVATAYHTPVHTIEMFDIVTPNFLSKVQRGEIINNPMEKTEHAYSLVAQNTSYRVLKANLKDYVDYSGQVFHSTPAFKALPTIDVGDLTALALSNAWANTSSSEASLLVSAAEAKKSVIGITDILKRFVKITRAVKKLQFQKLRKEISIPEVANRWLEVRYGLRPLVYDAKSIVDAWTVKAREKGARQTFRGYRYQTESTSDTVEQVFGSYQSYNWDRSSTRTVEVRAGVLAELDNLAANKAEVWGLLDVPQAVLDLTTFSFIAGWFFNIADVVSSWTPSASWRPRASWTVVKDITTEFTSCTGQIVYQHPRLRYATNDGGSSLQKITHIVRTPDPSRPIMPRWNLNINVSKLIDLVAIGKGLLRSIPGARF